MIQYLCSIQWNQLNSYTIKGRGLSGPFEEICPPSVGIKHLAKEKLHGTCMNNRQCTIMLLLNLAEPDWVSMKCNLKLLHNIICMKNNMKLDKIQRVDKNFYTNFKKIQDKYVCSQKQIILDDKCFAFLFQVTPTVRRDYCQEVEGKHATLKHLRQLHFIFNGILPVHKIPYIIVNNMSNVYLVNFKKISMILKVHWLELKIKKWMYITCASSTKET